MKLAKELSDINAGVFWPSVLRASRRAAAGIAFQASPVADHGEIAAFGAGLTQKITLLGTDFS